MHGTIVLLVKYSRPSNPVIDAYLATVLAFLPSDKYTIIYTTSPPADAEYQQVESQEQLYEYDEPYPSGMHTDLKRDLLAHTRASNSSNLDSNLPLFEKYQFLNAGKFIFEILHVL